MKKTIIIISSVILVVLASGGGYLWYRLKSVESDLKTAMIEKVAEKTNGLYKLGIKKLSIDRATQTLLLRGLDLRYDSTKLEEYLVGNRAKEFFLIQGTVASVRVQLINLDDIKKQGFITIRDFEIVSPDLEILAVNHTPDTVNQKAIKVVTKNLLNDMLASYFERVEINSLSLTDAKLKLSRNQEIFTIDQVSVRADSMVIDKSLGEDVLSHFANLSVEASNFYHLMKGKNDALSFKHIKFDRRKASIEIDSLGLIPLYAYDDYVARARHGRTEVKFPKIGLYGIHIEELVTKGNVNIDSIDIVNPILNGYANLQRTTTQEIKPLLHTVIQKLPLRIDLPVIMVRNGHVVYEEFGKHSTTQRGRITFGSVNVQIHGLTNDPESKSKYFQVRTQAMLFDRARLAVNFNLPLKGDTYNYIGRVGAMDLRAVNGMVTPLEHVGVESGRLTSVAFSVTANSWQANQTITFLYENLKISVANKANTGTNSFKTLLANVALLDANPSKAGRAPRVVSSTTMRDPMRSPFNYLWLTLRDGMLKSVTGKEVTKLLEKRAEKKLLRKEKAEKAKVEKVKKRDAKR